MHPTGGPYPPGEYFCSETMDIVFLIDKREMVKEKTLAPIKAFIREIVQQMDVKVTFYINY